MFLLLVFLVVAVALDNFNGIFTLEVVDKGREGNYANSKVADKFKELHIVLHNLVIKIYSLVLVFCFQEQQQRFFVELRILADRDFKRDYVFFVKSNPVTVHYYVDLSVPTVLHCKLSH